MASTSSDEKSRLMRNLKGIRTTNCALKMCSLLIDAQDMNDEYKQQGKKMRYSTLNNFSQDEMTLAKICNDIKEILNLEPADGLVKVIFKALNAPKETLCQDKEQLLNILSKPKYDKPTEYLNQLIEIVESLVAIFRCPSLNMAVCGKKLVILQEFLIGYGRHKAEKIFCEMFLLGINKYEFSWEEKKEIGDIVIEAMPNIEKIITELCYDFEYVSGHASLQQRSSLLFIRDLLAGYSAEQGTLKKFVGCLDLIMETLDNVAVWSDYADLYDPSDDSSRLSDKDVSSELHELLEEFNTAGAHHVPKEHTWWQVYKKAYFKF